MTATVDGSNIAYYRNGALVGSATAQTVANSGTANKISIGKLGDSNSLYFAGASQNIRIYNRALSAAEILRLYREPFAGLVFPEDRVLESAIWAPPPSSGRTLFGAVAEANDTGAVAAAVRIAGSSALAEAGDSSSVLCHVRVAGSAAIAEIRDNAQGSVRVAIAGSGVLHEANDVGLGHAGAPQAFVVDPNFLYLAPSRARSFIARTRLRTIIAS